jgi:nicotinamide phosphoribosyltransferase
MLKVIPKLLEMQDSAFGHTLTTKGFKKVNNVGIIQGDGIDYSTALEVIELIADMGYSADNVVFGSGGGLLQKLNRDTMKFAMKVGAYSNWAGDWVPIKKAPITDMGKASLSGRLRVYQNILTKEFYNVDISSNPVLSSELIPIMVDYYGLDMETLKPWFREDTLEYIRARCN